MFGIGWLKHACCSIVHHFTMSTQQQANILTRFVKSPEFKELEESAEWLCWHVINDKADPIFCVFNGLNKDEYTPKSVRDELHLQYPHHEAVSCYAQDTPNRNDLWDCIIPMHRKADDPPKFDKSCFQAESFQRKKQKGQSSQRRSPTPASDGNSAPSYQQGLSEEEAAKDDAKDTHSGKIVDLKPRPSHCPPRPRPSAGGNDGADKTQTATPQENTARNDRRGGHRERSRSRKSRSYSNPLPPIKRKMPQQQSRTTRKEWDSQKRRR